MNAALPLEARHDHLRPGDVAPYCLLRVAALPYAALEAMRMPRTEQGVADVLAAEHDMEACRPALEDAIYALVPKLDPADERLRRAVLALRRDVHNGRPTKVTMDDVEAVAGRLPVPDGVTLRAWAAAQARLGQALRQLEPDLLEELQTHARTALRAPLAVGTFRRALAFASVGVARNAQREKRLPTVPRPDNLERSLLGYLGRAAAKTSPFSSFMTLSVVPVDAQLDAPFPYAEGARCISRMRLNRGIASRLHRAGLVELAACGVIALTLNPTFAQTTPGRVQALCGREAVLLGRPWIEQRLAMFRLDPRIIGALVGGEPTATLANWCERLCAAGLDGVQARDVAGKLFERGVLVAPALCDAFDDAPERTLLARWQGAASATLRGLQPTLERMVATVEALCDVEGDGRGEAVDEIREGERTLLTALGQANAEPLQNMVLEDCWLAGIHGSVGRGLLGPLQDLQRFLSSQVIISPVYERLRGHFVREFGEGGECRDVLAFLLRIADKLFDYPEFGAKLEATASVPAPAGTPIPVTAQVQIAAGPDGAQPLLVVNRVFEGAGWLAARFSLGDQAGQRLLRGKIGQWLVDLHHPREPVDVLLGGQCNDLQAHAAVTRRVLQWPGEPVLAADVEPIDVRDLRLAHEPATGLLELRDAQGASISLVYLGSTFPNPSWGVRYAITVLTQPCLLQRPKFDPPPLRATDTITFEPRLVDGQLVLRRGTWWVSCDYLRKVWFAHGNEAERLLRVRRDCARHGIPDTVFAQRHIPPDGTGLIPSDALKSHRKPLWVDLRNPLWLAMLERIAQEGEWVSLCEPLPGPDGLWLQVDGRAHVSELQLEMIVRANPEAVPAPSFQRAT
jgi:hypothetical protein